MQARTCLSVRSRATRPPWSARKEHLGRMAALGALGMAGALLAGCALGPDFHEPAPPAGAQLLASAPPDRDMAADGVSQRFVDARDLPGAWWKRLGSPEIDALVERALARNPGLAEARATLRQNQAELTAGYGAFLPQLGASVGASRQDSVIDAGHGLTRTGAYDLGTAGLNASYTIDLFGAQRRTVEALSAQVDVQRFELLGAWQALSANVVQAAIAHAGYSAQRDALAQVLRGEDEQLALVKARVDAGVAAYASLLALRAQRDGTEAALAATQQRLAQNEHLLAQLCGEPPAQALSAPTDPAHITLPAELPAALPSDLARRRPDVLAAQAALHKASALVGVATADLFPTLTLGGSAGDAHARFADLLHAGTRYWSAQAGLAGSLFSGGTQWYARKAAIAGYDASLAQYEQTVLGALTQVADLMTAMPADARAAAAQVDARDAANDALTLTRAAYDAGTAGYLDLLSADAAYRQALVGAIAAQTQRLQDAVALYAAVGGGWWNEDVTVLRDGAARTAAPARPGT